MSTTIRPELSARNPYWLERHRYYELKHFCLQYPIWKQAYSSLDGLSKRPNDLSLFRTNEIGDPTTRCAIAKAHFLELMEIVDLTAKETDDELWQYLRTGVTEGLSYDQLKAKTNIPCSKDVYYDLYRRFFYLLNKRRG